jgi:hypothetical protein
VNGVALTKRFVPDAYAYGLEFIVKYIVAPCHNYQYMLKKRWNKDYETIKSRWDPKENMK